MIKVLHVVDKFGVKGSSVHGVSRLFSWWIPMFDKDRFDVRLIGLRRADEACANLRRQGIDVISLNKGKFDFSTITEIVKIVRQEKVDILHLHGYGATNFGRIAARISKVKNIVHEHFVDPAMPIYQVPFDYFLSQLTDFGIAVSKSVKDFMVEKRFLPKEKVKVVFNGAPLSDFKPLNKNMGAKEKKRWGISDRYKIIATIGRLDEQKGNEYLIDAAAKLLKRINNIKFMIIGDGPLMIKLKQRCVRYRIDKDVIFTGYQPDIPLIQSVVDIQVFPSLWEGTPLTVFEAMSMKRAIVSTDVDGLGEVLRHGENALLVSARDSEGLAHAIEDLLTHQYKSKRLAAQAELDSYEFDIQKTVDQIQQIYDEILRKR